MVDDNYKPYINIRLYGRTLQELAREGIVLKTILNGIGFMDVSISEGNIHIEKTADQQTQLLSTTFATVGVPRFSTPIVSQVDIRRKFTLDLPEQLSDIDSENEEVFDDKTSEISDERTPDIDLNNEEVIEEKHEYNINEDVLSENNYLDKILVEPIEIDDGQQHNASFETVPRSMEVDTRPSRTIFFEEPTPTETSVKHNVSNVDKQFIEPIYQNYEPMIREQKSRNEVPFDQELDIDHDGYEYHSFPNDEIEETVKMNVNENQKIENPSVQLSECKLNTLGLLQFDTVKTMSFETPVTPMRDDKVYKIKCSFPKCNREIPWKKQYGKLRLVEHALTHSKKNYLKCQKCGFLCNTYRKMQCHYKKEHKRSKLEGYGLSKMPTNDKGFQNIMNTCFGDQFTIKQPKPKKCCKNCGTKTEIQKVSRRRSSRNCTNSDC